jgi:hypothetical protein
VAVLDLRGYPLDRAAVAWAARLADDEAVETEVAALRLAASLSPDAVSWPTTFPDPVVALRAAMAEAVVALRAELDVDDGALDA